MSENEDSKGFYIFGRDVSKIPCFRNSFLYGIGGGIGVGLLAFMFTSRPKISSHIGMSMYVAITMTYWFQCQYNYSKTKFEMMKLQKIIEERALSEGTEKDEHITGLIGRPEEA